MGVYKQQAIDELNLDRDPTPEEEQQLFLSPDEKREHLQNRKLEKEIELRGQYACRAWWLALGWAAFSGFITLLQFCKPYGKQLEQAEFIAIVATALATIVALYVQVGKGMFSK
ncbi:MAG: hypothetical protein V4735_02185 [Pseudomonadota bacterium]